MPQGLHLCDDLIFESRVAGVAELLGLSMRTIRKWADVSSALEKTEPSAILVDLQFPNLTIDTFPASVSAREVFLLGYGSHVDAETLRRARQAGFDLVLPRSKFVEDLPTQLAVWLAGKTTT